MAQPWEVLARVEGRDGALELRRRGERDFLITLDGRVLMNSRAQRSEIALAEAGCAHLRERRGARLLVAGLGMGITLRAALDALPADAAVQVAEIEAAVAEWCAGPLAEVSGRALDDPRVSLRCEDVAVAIAEAAQSGPRLDAILLDLSEGPHARTDERDDPLYGSRALSRCRDALRPGGVLAVWAEAPDLGFARRLERAGFRVRVARPGRGGLRHAVYAAERPAPPGGRPPELC